MKKRLLCGIAVLLCICTVCVVHVEYVIGRRMIVRDFSYTEIKNSVTIYKKYAEISLESEDSQYGLAMLTMDDSYRFKDVIVKNYLHDAKFEKIPEISDDRNISVGVPIVAVVRAKRSVNNPIHIDIREDFVRILNEIKPWQTCGDYKREDIARQFSDTFVFCHQSYVETEVEIVEVIRQSSVLRFQAGDLLRIREPYFIADERVPNLMDEDGKLALCQADNLDGMPTWVPLEEGEVYLIFGEYVLEISRERYDGEKGLVVAGINHLFCLSDKTKPAGYALSDGIRQQAYAYIAEHFGY